MKKLDFGTISAGLDTLQNTLERNSGIGWSELVAADAIDFAEKNTYAADDTNETIRELADQIEVAGLLSPLGVIKEGTRYRLFSGERRYRAITTYLHWEKIPCQVFEGVSANKAQLMLHMANAAREYSPARKLELYEEYNALLRKMKENGEFSGGVQKGVAELLNVSDRQVRTYRTMAERLTPEEKEAVKSGEISFGEAKQVAVERASEEKTGTGSGFKREAAVKEADREEIPKQTIPIPSDGKAAPIKQTGTSCGFDPVNLTEQSDGETLSEKNQGYSGLNPKAVYERLSHCIPYAYLCLLEEILNEAEQPCEERERQMLQELKEVVQYARGWSHHHSKTDRDV
mgnify:CR=1 FL=1